MKRFISTKSLAAVALALGSIAVASAAHARDDVSFSVSVQSPGVYVHPAPVYVRPQPVYTPAPSSYGRHGHDRPYLERHGPYGDRDRDGIANVYDSGNSYNHRRHARLHGPYGDLDRDGIPNVHDRDRDGDGVRNRYDRLPGNPYRN